MAERINNTIKLNTMKNNLSYATPKLEFIEYVSEGVLCTSGSIEGWNESNLVSAAVLPAAVAEIDIPVAF